MKSRRFDNFIWITCLVIVVTLGWSYTSVAQKSTDTISTIVIDSAPKKLYSELYSDETGNQFMVEIYEEPQEGENLIHFRSFKNGEIIGRKSQALADAHNFTFFIDETEQRIMRQDTEQMLYNVLKKLMEESDQKLKTNLEDLFDQEKMAQSLSEKIKTPDEEIAAMATRISKEIQTPDEQIAAMASRISKGLDIFAVINTKIFLGALFIFVISIYGIFFRVLRVDLLRLKKQNNTYWLDMEHNLSDTIDKQY